MNIHLLVGEKMKIYFNLIWMENSTLGNISNRIEQQLPKIGQQRVLEIDAYESYVTLQ